jgi:hypothetical protein
MWIVTTRNCILHIFSCVLIIRLSRMKLFIDVPCVNDCCALWPWSNVNRNLIPQCWTIELDARSRRDCGWIETLRAMASWSRLISGVSQWCHWWNGASLKLHNTLEKSDLICLLLTRLITKGNLMRGRMNHITSKWFRFSAGIRSKLELKAFLNISNSWNIDPFPSMNFLDEMRILTQILIV